MNSKKSREIKKIALKFFTKKIEKDYGKQTESNNPFKNFYRKFKKQYIRGEYK